MITQELQQAAIRAAIAVAGVLVLASLALPAEAGEREVPFGDKVSGAIVNYDRATPHVATAGLVTGNGVSELAALGFATIVDLRTLAEGTAEEQAAAEQAGIRYVNIPIAKAPPSATQIEAFAKILADAGNAPLLLHCVSGNRAGTFWAAYRVTAGVPFEVAMEEGRTAGMTPAREQQLRSLLGRPAASE